MTVEVESIRGIQGTRSSSRTQATWLYRPIAAGYFGKG